MFFCHISMLSVRRFCLNKLTILSFFLFISSHINAQIDIKSKVDAQTYADYSKAIDFFENNISPNDLVTLFIPINYSFNRLSQEKQTALLNSNLSEISQFIRNHSSSIIIDSNYLSSNFNSNISLNNFYLLNNKKIYFQKNGDGLLFGDSYSPLLVTFESNLVKSFKLSDKIMLNFLDGIFLY